MKGLLVSILTPHLPHGLLQWFCIRVSRYVFDQQTADLRKGYYHRYALPVLATAIDQKIQQRAELTRHVGVCDHTWSLNYDRKDTVRQGRVPRDVVRLRKCVCRYFFQRQTWEWSSWGGCEDCHVKQDKIVQRMQVKKIKKALQ